MLKKISAVKARQNLGQIMNEVFFKDYQYLIERDGKPLVAVVPTWKLEQWEERKSKFFATAAIIRDKFKDLDEKTVDELLSEAVSEARGTYSENEKPADRS